ncbi:TNF receptor-associated factor1b, partial [Sesamum alatum]
PKPSELYGTYTWKIDKFSQINKRELRSNAFEVGGYKWCILIYPQDCDVCNHLSLFLCVRIMTNFFQGGVILRNSLLLWAKLVKLIEDKVRWSSFCAFWLGMDQSSRRRMSREKTESILKVVVKHFFIEKEVTSTLVVDSLYSGLKGLEGQNKAKKSKGKYLEAEDLPVPVVRTEKDTFVLVDDVLLLLERAAMEPLPPKDEKGPQNRMKVISLYATLCALPKCTRYLFFSINE